MSLKQLNKDYVFKMIYKPEVLLFIVLISMRLYLLEQKIESRPTSAPGLIFSRFFENLTIALKKSLSLPPILGHRPH